MVSQKDPLCIPKVPADPGGGQTDNQNRTSGQCGPRDAATRHTGAILGAAFLPGAEPMTPWSADHTQDRESYQRHGYSLRRETPFL